MIYSIVPYDLIFSEPDADVSYIQKNGILFESCEGKIRRIISTNPFDYMTDLTFTDKTETSSFTQ